MRDHSKDKNMVDDEYYGVKGVKKKSNAYVITWLIMFTVVGTFLYALTGMWVLLFDQLTLYNILLIYDIVIDDQL